MHFKCKTLFLYIFCIILFTSSIVIKTFQNDTFFTIATGNYILENGVDEVEPFTFHDNLRFIKLRWAFDITVALIYNNFGFVGLYVFVVVMANFIGIVTFLMLLKSNRNGIVSFIATLLMIYGMRFGFTCRAQIISYLIFAMELFFIQKLLETNKIKYSLALCLSSLILVNFHSSVWLTFFLPFIAYIVSWALNRCGLFKHDLTNDLVLDEDINILKLITTMAICLLTGFCTPLGLSPFTYMFKVMGGISSTFIAELQVPRVHRLVVLCVILYGFVLISFIGKIKTKVSDLLLITGFSVFGIVISRNSYISILFLIYPVTNFVFLCFRKINKEALLESFNTFVENKKIVRLILFLLIVGLSVFMAYRRKDLQYVSSDYPVGAVEYIEKNLDIDKMRLYTGFNYGSYAELKGIKVFLDSRSEVYTREFSNVTILEDFLKLIDEEEECFVHDLQEKYGFTHWLVYNDEYIDKQLQEDDKYNLLYEDEKFRLYEVE